MGRSICMHVVLPLPLGYYLISLVNLAMSLTLQINLVTVAFIWPLHNFCRILQQALNPTIST